MPAFIKSEKDEKIWSKAKSLAHKSYPDLSEDNEDFWKVTNSIYHKIKGGSAGKTIRKEAFDGFRFDGQPLRGMDQFTDFTMPVSQQTKDYTNGEAYKHTDEYRKINKALTDIHTQYPALSADLKVDPKNRNKPIEGPVNPFYYYKASRQPIQWGEKFGIVSFTGDPVNVRTDIIYNQGNNADPLTGKPRTREEIFRNQQALYRAKQAERKRGWGNLRPDSTFAVPKAFLANQDYYIPFPHKMYFPEYGKDVTTMPAGELASGVMEGFTGNPNIARYELFQGSVRNGEGVIKPFRAYSWGNADKLGGLAFSDIVNWKSSDTLNHEGLPGTGHKDTTTPKGKASIYLNGLSADDSEKTGRAWRAQNGDKQKTLLSTRNGSAYTYYEPKHPESTLSYYTDPNELNGLNSRIQLLLSRMGYDTDRFELEPGKAPNKSGKFWDALSAMKHAGWVDDGFSTGYYGVVNPKAFSGGPVPVADLVPHSNLEAWVAHVNRLKYLKGLIESGSASAADRAEYRRILTTMQDSYKQ